MGLDSTVMFWAQGFSAGSWATVIIAFSPDVWRSLCWRANKAEIFGTLWAATGLLHVGTTARWYIYPKTIVHMEQIELASWLFLFVYSGVIANVLLIYTALYYRRRVK